MLKYVVRPELRPSNTGNIFRATCRATMLRCKLRWFVARITAFLRNKFSCCKKWKRLFNFLQHKKIVAQEGGNTRNKPSQLAAQHCCATSCTKNVARITGHLMISYEKAVVLYIICRVPCRLFRRWDLRRISNRCLEITLLILLQLAASYSVLENITTLLLSTEKRPTV